MPKFTITRDGKPVSQTEAHGERIELGSARTCPVQIDDLLISLKQAALFRTSPTALYHVEAVSRVPAFTLNGLVVESPVEVPDGAVIGIEGYEIRIQYVPGEMAGTPAPSVTPTAAPVVSAPPIPQPLEPDLPPPLDLSQPSVVTSPVVTSPPHTSSHDMERTVFIRRVGKLTATAGPLAGQHWDLKSGETRIGREIGQNDIVIRFDAEGNVDNSVSRRHASVHVIGDKVFVEDAGSAAGTYLNGQAVPPGQRVEVKAQDQIEIRSSRASSILRVELDRGAPIQPAVPPVTQQPVAVAAEPQRPAPVLASAPRHEAPGPGDFGVEDAPIPRRRRRESASADNPFVPTEEPRGRGKIPTWGWIVAGVGILMLLAIIVLLAL